MSQRHRRMTAALPRRSPATRAVLCAGVFLAVLGCRLWLISAFASPIPFWDEWDGEAASLLKPFLEHRLHPADLFLPHNEHVIFFTRALTLGVYWLTGFWDVVLQMVINATLYALILTAILAALARHLADRDLLIAALASAAVAAIPFAWENILFGFATQFAVLIGLSAAALVC